MISFTFKHFQYTIYKLGFQESSFKEELAVADEKADKPIDDKPEEDCYIWLFHQIREHIDIYIYIHKLFHINAYA